MPIDPGTAILAIGTFVGGQVVIAWLEVSAEVLKSRLEQREAAQTHFFPASLLASQLDTAEPPDPAG